MGRRGETQYPPFTSKLGVISLLDAPATTSRPAHPSGTSTLIKPCLLPPCPTLLPLQVTEPALAPFLSSTVLSSPSLEHLFATLLSDKLAVSWMLSTVKLAGLLEVCMGGSAGMAHMTGEGPCAMR